MSMNDLSVCDLDLDGVALGALLLHSVRGEVQSVSKQIIRCILKGIQNPSK